MSEATEQVVGKEAVEQHQGFREMVVIDPVKPETPDDFGSDLSEVRRAADELSSRREADQIAREARPNDGERDYYHQGGPNAGQRMPANETVSAEQASHDLSRMRELEALADATALEAEIAASIDRIRAGDTAERPQQQAIDPQQEWQSLSEQQRAERWAAMPEEHKAALLQQAETARQQADAEVSRALQEHPALISAVEQEVQKRAAYADYTAQQYAEAVTHNAYVATATLVAQFPELANLNPYQIPTAIQVVAKQNPDRARAIVYHIEQVRGLVNEANRVQQQQVAQQQSQQQLQFAKWAHQHDNAFDKWALEQASPEERKAVVDEVKDGRELHACCRRGCGPQDVWPDHP